jgi:hypothetical protein
MAALEAVVNERDISAEPQLDRRGRSQVYLAAAVCIMLGISLTAIAIWQLDDSEQSGRLNAVPWRCCLADP